METREGVQIILDRFDRIESKLDVIQTHAAAIDATLAGQAKDIQYHIKRTDLLEAAVAINSAYRDRFHGAWRLVVAVGILLGIAATIFQLYRGA